jgi:hypothetical protein
MDAIRSNAHWNDAHSDRGGGGGSGSGGGGVDLYVPRASYHHHHGHHSSLKPHGNSKAGRALATQVAAVGSATVVRL